MSLASFRRGPIYQTYFWTGTAILIFGPIIGFVWIWFFSGAAINAKIAGTLAIPLAWLVFAMVFGAPIADSLDADNAEDAYRKAHPDATDAQVAAHVKAELAARCNCPNFITNLGLPHVSDCPQFGNPRNR